MKILFSSKSGANKRKHHLCVCFMRLEKSVKCSAGTHML